MSHELTDSHDEVDLKDTVHLEVQEDFASRFFVEPSVGIAVSYGGATHVGNVRENNEDHFAVIHRFRSQHLLLTNLPRENLPNFRDEAYAFIVADGLGGAAAGELASRLVMEEAWELSAQATSWVMKFHDATSQQLRERLEAYTTRMHEKLLKIAEENPRLHGMGTTWTSAYVLGWNAIIAHVGDSRAYLFREGNLRQLTRDHTLAQALADLGVAQEKIDSFRNVLTRTLGGKHNEAVPDAEHVVLQDGDRLLLCTDGLSDQISDADIAAVLGKVSAPQAACDALIAAALKAGGRDNITAVLAAFEKVD